MAYFSSSYHTNSARSSVQAQILPVNRAKSRKVLMCKENFQIWKSAVVEDRFVSLSAGAKTGDFERSYTSDRVH